jgi:hypothetical protein
VPTDEEMMALASPDRSLTSRKANPYLHWTR